MFFLSCDLRTLWLNKDWSPQFHSLTSWAGQTSLKENVLELCGGESKGKKTITRKKNYLFISLILNEIYLFEFVKIFENLMWGIFYVKELKKVIKLILLGERLCQKQWGGWRLNEALLAYCGCTYSLQGISCFVV